MYIFWLYEVTSTVRCWQEVYHILIFTVVSPLGQECSEKYYGHEVIMKLCTGYAVLSEIYTL
jgi:hypothetical protein